MTSNITDTNPDAVDVVLSLAVAAFLAAILAFIWVAVEGTHVAEPSRVTTAVAPDSEPVIADLEEP